MCSQPEARTLLDDWRERRESLAQLPARDEQFRDVQLRVLDYLLKRYRDSVEASRPLALPPASPFYVNQRAIVVHHHLGQGELGAVKTAQEAHDRVASVLQRMQLPVEDRAEAFADVWEEEIDSDSTDPQSRPMSLSLWRRALQDIHCSLQPPSLLPERVVFAMARHLANCADDDIDVAQRLCECRNESALNYAVMAWRERLAGRPRDCVIQTLEKHFCSDEMRGRSADKIRAELANANAPVRLAAARLLPRFAALSDVSLFSDLLALPVLDDEAPGERAHLAAAMQRISGMTREADGEV